MFKSIYLMIHFLDAVADDDSRDGDRLLQVEHPASGEQVQESGQGRQGLSGEERSHVNLRGFHLFFIQTRKT